ncbi:phage tail sheath family protein [Amycolatopsis samaneae]|uniref:Phage tail sheath family protein n=1 Tax=Amycolatopsis samaneae TaxID=664691 RepID=A0ABW5GEB9_9PSEU
MPEYLAPGTYVEEVRSAVVPIQGVGTSTAGFVGLTERGPTEALLITSMPEFQRWYGDLLDPARSALPWSVQGFFANGGQRVFVARVTRGDAKSANLALSDGLTVTAHGAGEWGDRVRVWVRASSKDPANRFRLTVAYLAAGVQPDGDPKKLIGQAAVVEDYDGLSVNPKDSRYVVGAINPASHLISLSVDGTVTKPEAGENFTVLGGGADGDAEMTAKEFIGDENAPSNKKTGLAALAAIDEISILAVPDAVNAQLFPNLADQNAVAEAVVAQCEKLHDRFAVLDIAPGKGNLPSDQNRIPVGPSEFAAIYYPHVRVFDPRSRTTQLLPPSGFVAGIYAFNDVTRGVHKAPANYEVRGILSTDLSPVEGPLEFTVTKGQQDILNPVGINVIRDFRGQGRGIRLWGARTISDDPDWKYVNVRRLFNFVEESVDEGLQFVVFEPNSPETWDRVRRSISVFLERVWRDGALLGEKREEAFFVRCDRTTMSTDDILNGRLICLVGLAAVRPAEFVVLRFSQFTVESGN